jgi:hypothetical protein
LTVSLCRLAITLILLLSILYICIVWRRWTLF